MKTALRECNTCADWSLRMAECSFVSVEWVTSLVTCSKHLSARCRINQMLNNWAINDLVGLHLKIMTQCNIYIPYKRWANGVVVTLGRQNAKGLSTLVPKIRYFVSGNRILCIRNRRFCCRKRQQSRLLPDTNLPFLTMKSPETATK